MSTLTLTTDQALLLSLIATPVDNKTLNWDLILHELRLKGSVKGLNEHAARERWRVLRKRIRAAQADAGSGAVERKAGGKGVAGGKAKTRRSRLERRSREKIVRT
jgi:hypothetical protein